MSDGKDRVSLTDILKKTGIVVGSAAVGIGGAIGGCDCGTVVDPPPPPSDSSVVDPPPPPSDSAVDSATDAGVGTDSATGFDSGMVVDPPPPPMDSGADSAYLSPTLMDNAADTLPLNPSFRVELRVAGVHEDRALILKAMGRLANCDSDYTWKVAGGEVEPIGDGEIAHWTPPAEPGRYLVQVVVEHTDDSAAVAAIELEV